jgi:hypothetical protein
MAEKRGNRRWWILAAALFFTLFLIPLRFGLHSDLRERLLDAAHTPAFATLAWYLLRHLPAAWTQTRRLSVTLAIAVVLSIGIELLQGWSGRQASATDALYSVAGAFLAVLGHCLWPRGFGSRFAFILYSAWICAGVVLPAWRIWGALCWREAAFPLIADFEERSEFRLWLATIPWDNPYASTVSPSVRGVSHGAQSARVAIEAAPGYPATRLYLADQDWSAYQTLAFDVFNPGEPFELSVRIDDSYPAPRHNDRYNGVFPMARGWNHVRVPLAEIQRAARDRPLNLTAIRRLIFFLDQPKTPRVFYLDWIRLE